MMTEVRYEKMDYCKYRNMELVLGLLFNTAFGFVVGLLAFSHELDGSVWRWVMVLYGVGSVVYAGYAMPKYLLTLRWVTDRPKKELVEVRMLDAGTVLVNGYAWDVSYWDRKEIVLDCESGIAHLPFRRKGVPM